MNSVGRMVEVRPKNTTKRILKNLQKKKGTETVELNLHDIQFYNYDVDDHDFKYNDCF